MRLFTLFLAYISNVTCTKKIRITKFTKDNMVPESSFYSSNQRLKVKIHIETYSQRYSYIVVDILSHPHIGYRSLGRPYCSHAKTENTVLRLRELSELFNCMSCDCLRDTNRIFYSIRNCFSQFRIGPDFTNRWHKELHGLIFE